MVASSPTCASPSTSGAARLTRAVSGASRMPHAHANGIDIHYRITGDGPETAVLVNGVGDDLEGWALQVDPSGRRRAARGHV